MNNKHRRRILKLQSEESFDIYTLNVVGPDAFTYEGGTKNYTIQSYGSDTEGANIQPVKWTATYSTDGGSTFTSTKPSWITSITNTDKGGDTITTYSVTVDAQTVTTETNNPTSILQSATPLGSSSDYYDLSDPTGIGTPQYTANCYMIHAPGYYKLPLVYGNAIGRVGSPAIDNEQAYKPGGTAVTNYAVNLTNHAGANIIAPWITKSGTGVNGGMGITVDSAQLVWQDVDGLTSDYSIDGDYLKFKVSAESIREGNAVIAAKSGSTIVWSWHIWITPETYSDLITATVPYFIYKVAPVNLGWVNSGDIVKTGYAKRSCIVKVSQTGGQEKMFDITQTQNTQFETINGSSPYYQWGRKDPFVPADPGSNTDKTVYVGDGVPELGYRVKESTDITRNDNIKYPYTFHVCPVSSYNYFIPGAAYQYNLWNAVAADPDHYTYNLPTKTIYDPCPPGFCVPTSFLYYYMDYTRSSQQGYVGGYWDSANNCMSFEFDEGVVQLPALGGRLFFDFERSYTGNDMTGKINGVNTRLDYWTSQPENSNRGKALYSTNSGENISMIFGNEAAAAGALVRPISEVVTLRQNN